VEGRLALEILSTIEGLNCLSCKAVWTRAKREEDDDPGRGGTPVIAVAGEDGESLGASWGDRSPDRGDL